MESNFKNIEGGEVTSFSTPNCQNESSNSRLFVAGDSHAGAYLPMLQRLTMETGLNVNLYTKVGCSYINFFEPLAQLSVDCQLFYKSTTKDILENAGCALKDCGIAN
jgi:hypothetical protein